MQEGQAVCACTRVVYAPKHLIGGAMCDQWLCNDCGREFIKKSVGFDTFKKAAMVEAKAEVCADLLDYKPGGSTPSQYALPPEANELQDLIEYREMNFAMGNIFKACYRNKDVGDPLYDIRKIIWFAKREEARLMKETSNG